jgi:predicted acetyltransferase
MLISGAASSCGPLGLKLRAIRQKERRDMKEFFIVNKYRSVALALAVFAVAGTAPAFAQSSGTWSAGISTRTGLPFRFVGDGDAADD